VSDGTSISQRDSAAAAAPDTPPGGPGGSDADPPADGGLFEQGPIRPPSEAQSLLIRVTRNCPWSRCAFCHTYQGKPFSLRPVAEVRADIRRIARTAERVQAISRQVGEAGGVGRKTILKIFDGENSDDSLRSVAAWLHYGGDSVFLQDANSLVLKTDDLAEVISFIRETFPSVTRITTYARARTAARKTLIDFIRLREAGLSRIHVGMESGYDPLLEFIGKGVTAAELVDGGQKIREAGISLCEYVMPGLGGRRWSREHAIETARVLNLIEPNHIRLRTLQVVPGTLLAQKVRKGQFDPPDDEEILREIRLFIESLQGIMTEIVSDHILNLLEELAGKLPGDRERLIGVIDRFFSLSAEERLIFRLGRRLGLYRTLDDLADGHTYQRLEPLVWKYQGKSPDALEHDLAELRRRYI
jgi:hypothetical protein